MLIATPPCTPAEPYRSAIGVMANGIRNPQARAQMSASLGSVVVRMNAAKVGATAEDPQNAAARARGLAPVLTIVNRETASTTQSNPPSDLAAYAAGVARQVRLNRPRLAVIENEEIAPKFYSGTADQYLAQLAVAVRAAHAEHTPVTNGGLVYRATELVTWDDLWRRGRRAEADDYAARAFADLPAVRNGLPSSADPSKPVLASSPRFATTLANARTLVAGYARSRMDYVNFHWYGSRRDVLDESVRALQRLTGKSAVTNEIGQYDTSPDTVRSVMAGAVEDLRLRFVVWYAADGNPAKGLYEPGGGAVRPTGDAFRAFARSHEVGDVDPVVAAACPRGLLKPASTALRADRHGRALAKVRCPAGGSACTGTARIGDGDRRRYRLLPARRATLRLALTRDVRRALERDRAVRVRLELRRDGGRTRVARVRIAG